jgi:protein SCO1/2
MTRPITRVCYPRPALLVALASLFLMAAIAAGTGSPTAGSKLAGPFVLTDHNGRAVTDRDMRGHPYLIFFGFAHCADVDLTTLSEVSEVLARLGPDADRVGVLFVTVDPERDTPDKLKHYLSTFDPHIRGLTGDAAAIEAVINAYHIYRHKVPLTDGSYAVDHTTAVYLVDKGGSFVGPFDVKRRAEDVVADLRRFL